MDFPTTEGSSAKAAFDPALRMVSVKMTIAAEKEWGVGGPGLSVIKFYSNAER